MAFLTEVAEQHRREMRVAPGGEDGEAVPRRPQDDAGDPLLEPEPDRGGDRAVDDRESTRGAAEQDRRPERAVDRHLKPGDVLGAGVVDGPAHAISAPPPKLKKLRKKLDAANAIDRPNTI